MDVFTRQIVGWELSRGLGLELTLGALARALEGARPGIHHSDQGLQYAAAGYVALLKEHGARPSMAAAGRADQNGYAERVIRTIKEEEVALNEYPDYEAARQQLGRFIDDVYQKKRIHSALGYLTPEEFGLSGRPPPRSCPCLIPRFRCPENRDHYTSFSTQFSLGSAFILL